MSRCPFEGDNHFDVGVFDRRQPARTAALRVSEQDGRADLREQRRHGIRDHARIVRARVGRHRPKELVQRLRLAIELHVVEVLRPLADPELVEKSWSNGVGSIVAATVLLPARPRRG